MTRMVSIVQDKYTVIDLFAGAGGLSYGFEQTKKFIVKVAVENNKAARDTYKDNHHNVDAIYTDIRDVDYTDIKRRFKKIDVVIGGPPCQGFSNANRQHNCAINQNNLLVKEYVRAVLSLKPQAFVLENVGMLKSSVHKFLVARNDTVPPSLTIKDESIVLLEEAYAGNITPQEMACLANGEYCKWTDEDYSLLNGLLKKQKNLKKAEAYLKKHQKKFLTFNPLISNNEKFKLFDDATLQCIKGINQYYDNTIGADELVSITTPSIMFQRMFGKIEELNTNSICYSLIYSEGVKAEVKTYSIFDYLQIKFHQAGYGIKAGVLCAADYGVPQKRFRFIMVGIKHMHDDEIVLPRKKYQENHYYTVKDAIGDLETVPVSTNILTGFNGVKATPCRSKNFLYNQLHDTSIIRNHVVTSTRKNALARFEVLKQGENFHSLSKELTENTYSDISRTQNTIYQRLDYNKPSGTVLNVRKSMWIHPVLNRAISIREAARLQSFPDSFRFSGTKDAQYQQIGNAVPPFMAKAIASNLYSLLKKRNKLK